MPPKCSICSRLFILLVLVTGALAEQKCSVISSKEVRMGTSFNVSCVFGTECQGKLIYQDEVTLNYPKSISDVVTLSIVNLTKTTTFTCKCHVNSEPCGIDITPGYPPDVPQNLTCVQEGEFGKVNCSWRTGWETHIRTTSLLWVMGNPGVNYTALNHHSGKFSASFPVSGTQTQFFVLVCASNSLGSATSPVLSFKLDDIVKPLSPHIKKVECASRHCQLQLDKPNSIQLVEIQYSAGGWSWNTISFNRTHSNENWIVTSLSPYSLYTFRVRWKFSPIRGLWSEWSTAENTTDEDVPVTMLDAWYIEESAQAVNTSFTLFWKELSSSEARGKILQYNLTMGTQTKTISAAEQRYRVDCSFCSVSISAINSKGQSPARLLHLQTIEPLQSSVSHKYVDNHSIALFWQSSGGAGTLTEHLVEWHPTGRKKELQWVRVKRDVNTTHITGLTPAVCYEGAVIYLCSNGMQKTVFSGVSTWQSAPLQGPKCNAIVKSESVVVVNWEEIAPEQRGGCLTNYTIYLEALGDKVQKYNVSHPRRELTIQDMAKAQEYKLWVSAWTLAGEGPKGSQPCFYTINPHVPLADKHLALVVSVGSAVFLTCLFLLCICHFPSVYRRLSRCCHCLLPSIVPDPANSKWAKECTSEKGEMKLHLYLSDSSMSEDDPDTVEVQELPREKVPSTETLPADGTQHSITDRAQEPCVPSAPYQPTFTSTYLKSFSQESSCSDATQASRNTDTTVDYISAHGVMSEEEDDEDEDNMELLTFFPCQQSPFLDPLISFGGKLTLDTVKIDCSDFLDCV